MKTIQNYFSEFIDAEKVMRVYGHFPSLHDCEVLSISLNRELEADFSGPKAKIEFYIFDTAEHPESPLRRPSKLTLLFDKIKLEDLQGFNHQNAFSDLKVEEFICDPLRQRRLRFDFGEGWSIRFSASQVTVLSIEPFVPVDWFTKQNEKTTSASAGCAVPEEGRSEKVK